MDYRHSRPCSSIKKRHSRDDPKLENTSEAMLPKCEVKSESSQASKKTGCRPSIPCSSYMKRHCKDDSNLDEESLEHNPGSELSAEQTAANLGASISSKPRRAEELATATNDTVISCATSFTDHKMPPTASRPEASAQQIGLNHSWPSSAFSMRRSSKGISDSNQISDSITSHHYVTSSGYGSIQTSFPKLPKECHSQKSKDLSTSETSMYQANCDLTNQCDPEEPVSSQKKKKAAQAEQSEASASALSSASKADGCSLKAKGSKRSPKVFSDSSFSSMEPSKSHSKRQINPAVVDHSKIPASSTQEKKQVTNAAQPISVSKVDGRSTRAKKATKGSKPVAPNDSRKPQSVPSMNKTHKFDSANSAQHSSKMTEDKSSASSSVSRQEGGASQTKKLATVHTAISKSKDCSSQDKKCTPKLPHKVIAVKTSSSQSSHLHSSELMLSKKSSQKHETLALHPSVSKCDGSSSQAKKSMSIQHVRDDMAPQAKPPECHDSKKSPSYKKKKRSKQNETSANPPVEVSLNSLYPKGSTNDFQEPLNSCFSKNQACSSKPASADSSTALKTSPTAKKAPSSQVKVIQSTTESTNCAFGPSLASKTLPVSVSSTDTSLSQRAYANQTAQSSKQVVKDSSTLQTLKNTGSESSGLREPNSLLNNEADDIKPKHHPLSQADLVTLSQASSIISSPSLAESSKVLPQTSCTVNSSTKTSLLPQEGFSKASMFPTDLKAQPPNSSKKVPSEAVASKNPLHFSNQAASSKKALSQADSKMNPLSHRGSSMNAVSQSGSKSNPQSQAESQANSTNKQTKNTLSEVNVPNPDSIKSPLSQANSNSEKKLQSQTDFSKNPLSQAGSSNQVASNKIALSRLYSKMSQLCQDSSKTQVNSTLNPHSQTGGKIQSGASKYTLFPRINPLSQGQTGFSMNALSQATSKAQCQSETDTSKNPLFQAGSSEISSPLSQTDSETTSLSQTDSSRATFSPLDISMDSLSQEDCYKNSFSETDSSDNLLSPTNSNTYLKAEKAGFSKNSLSHADFCSNPLYQADFEAKFRTRRSSQSDSRTSRSSKKGSCRNSLDDFTAEFSQADFHSKSRTRQSSQSDSRASLVTKEPGNEVNSRTSPSSKKGSRRSSLLADFTAEFSTSSVEITNSSTISTKVLSNADSSVKLTESGLRLTSAKAHSKAMPYHSNLKPANKPLFSTDYNKKPLLQTHSVAMPISQTDFSTKRERSIQMKSAIQRFTEELECMKAVYTTRCKQEVQRLRAKQWKKKITLYNSASLDLEEALIQWKEGPRMIQESIAESQKTLKVFMHYYDKVTEEFENLNADGNLSINALSSFNREFRREIRRCNVRLPIYAHRLDIMKMIDKQQVSIVIGETGSGKSTQLVQYLYEAGYSSKGLIACTQPRKLAAISLAEHVSKEVNERVGRTYGYVTTT